MKINWGHKIVVLYTGFVALIAILVIGSMRQKIDLVADDYYEQELLYQDRIDQISNTAELEEGVDIRLTEDELVISYPEIEPSGTLKGEITMFRPSDKSLDKTFMISADSDNRQIIHTEEMESGMYRIKIEFNLNSKEYYVEKVVVIP